MQIETAENFLGVIGNYLGLKLNDLYILPDSARETDKIIDFLQKNKIGHSFSLSDLKGQSWYGRLIIIASFAESRKNEIQNLAGA